MNRTLVNIACSVLVLAVNVAINLVLSPIIVATLGAEANGFVMLANNCVTYAQLLVTAISSMAARFITIEHTRGNYDKANLYYNSVFWGNLVLTMILMVPACFCIVYLELVFDVPADILWDVKLLFAFVFANFLVTTALPKYDCGPYAVNRLDRSYIAQAAGQIARCIVVFSLFALLAPHVWYVGLAASVMTAITLIANVYNTHALTTELRVGIGKGKRRFSFAALKELFFSGIWNSVNSVGNMLSFGLSALISNVMLGATAMGVMSLSQTLPTLMQQLSGSICNALAPELTIDWAKGDRDRLVRNVERAMTLTSCIMTVPLVGIMVFGDRFYELWVPSQDAQLLWTLSVLGLFGYAFTSGVQILYNVFTTVNKVWSNAMAVLIGGVVSVVATLTLLNATSFGLYVVAGVPSLVALIRNMTFMLPATARYLGLKWYRFYPQVLKSMVTVAALLVLGFMVKLAIPGGTWPLLISAVALFALMGFGFNALFLLNREERGQLVNKVKTAAARISGRKG